MIRYTLSGERPFMTISYIVEQLLMAHGLTHSDGASLEFDGETVTLTLELPHA